MSFAALMALSASQTKESQSAVQTALLQRQRNEELQRKKREEFDRKEREEATKLRQKRFEDEKKQRELQLKRESEMRRMEEEQARREEEQRNALLYGPKRAKSGSKWPSSSGISKESIPRRRLPSDEEDGSRSGSPAMALTREEKRRRRVETELRRGYAYKRAASSSGYHKAGRRLPGGAIDATSAPTSDSGNGSQSVKARLSALPNTLTKLNVHKRDTRTIDEILQDRAKAKTATLDGDDAKEFNDWFGKGKKDTGKTSAQVSTAAPSRESSGSSSPVPSAPRSVNSGTSKTSTASKSAALSFSKTSQSKGADSSQSLKTEVKSKSTSIFTPSMKSQASKPSSAARSTGPTKKRPRSPSSLSPPPPKRRPASTEVESYSNEIWKLFGKDRSKYVEQDVYSDEEDMEVDAGVLEREELRSARLARKEDEAALEQEKRHEEEKRRKKREREMKERRG
ncbi:uncharacterized protein HD556DRAFT_1325819 [Suillus plorans]|uniref:SPT2 chromatin protein n=1 Tax=Suillus plorans TaxID=116603 RepID=A0A9P7DWH3_9AGAM|nr:uncharacterized protein HD556DRAFT_1325819 [Suillus plorans]KAG1804731.1 hypothetical protein HD556DRAFT_1325819 [Suillus plorans]